MATPVFVAGCWYLGNLYKLDHLVNCMFKGFIESFLNTNGFAPLLSNLLSSHSPNNTTAP